MDKKALIYIIAAGIGWGALGIFVNILPDISLSTPQIVSIRTGISAIIILTYILITSPKNFRTKREHIILHVLNGVSLYGTGSFYYSAIKETSVSVAVMLMYMAIVIVMCYSVIFLGEKFTYKKAVAVIMTLVGCAFVTGLIGNIKYTAYGIFLGFMSAVSYSAYNIITKIEMKKGIHPLTSTAYCFIFATILSILVANPVSTVTTVVNNGPLIILWAVGIAVVTCTMPYFLYALALKKLSAGVAASLAIIEPMSASIFSIVFFKERLSINLFIGIILILSSVVILSTTNANTN